MSILRLSNEGFQFPSDVVLPGLKTVLTALILFNRDFSQAIPKSLCEFLRRLGIYEENEKSVKIHLLGVAVVSNEQRPLKITKQAMEECWTSVIKKTQE